MRVRGRNQDRAACRPDRAGRRGPGGRSLVGQGGIDEKAQVRLGRQSAPGGLVKAGSDDHLEEDRYERLGEGTVHLPGEPDHAPEGRDGIAGQGIPPGFHRAPALGRAARIGVLDDDAGWTAQRAGQCRRCSRVEDVVVGERFALEPRLPGRERARLGTPAEPAVARGRLVRVLTVAQRLDLFERDSQRRRELVRRTWQPGLIRQVQSGRVHRARQLGRHPRVVGRGMAEGFDRQGRAHAGQNAAELLDRDEHRLVPCGCRDDRHRRMVLGGRPNQ